MRFSLGGPSGVGVSFHEHTVEMLRIDGPGPFSVTGHVLLSFPGEVYDNGWIKNQSAFLEAVRQKSRDSGLAVERPTLCLPTSAVVLRTLTLPRTGRKQARSLIQFQLAQELHLPFTDPVFDFDYYPPGFPHPEGYEAEGGVPALLAAAPGGLVHRAERAFRNLKAPLQAVELKGLATLRALRHLERAVDRGTLLVHFGPDAVDVHFYVKGQLVLSRWLDLSPREYSAPQSVESQGHPGGPGPAESEVFGAAGTPAQAEAAAGISEGEGTWLAVRQTGANVDAFAADLQYQVDRLFSFLQYTLRREDLAVNRIWLAGYVPHPGTIVQGLTDHLALPVEMLDTPKDPRGNPVDLPAFGAALRGRVPDED